MQEQHISLLSMPAFSGIFTNFESFTIKCYNHNFNDTLLYRGFSLYFNMEMIYHETSTVISCKSQTLKFEV